VPGREELISGLTRELRPAPRLRRPGLLALLVFAGGWLAVLAVGLAVAPMRPGFADQLLAHPRFAVETGFGLAAGALALAVAFALGVPGRRSPGPRWASGLAALGLWAAFYVYGLSAPALEPSMLGKRPHCALEVLLYGVPVLVVGLLLLRRLAPLQRRRSALLLGAAAGAIPALFMQLACMYDPLHALALHVGPMLGVALAGFLLGPLLLRRI
jgi:hypothetical protein